MKTLKLALALLLLAFTSSCTSTSNTSAEIQRPQKAANVAKTTIKIDGSSTVYPITQAIAKEYQADSNNQVQVTVGISGTTGGFEKFCAGVTDISNASRPILKSEMEVCKKNGVGYMEFPIAFDALTIAVNPQNTWAKDITVAELKRIWEPGAEGKITRWNQIQASYPDRPLNLYGAGQKSGTFDYFTEATVGQVRANRNDYTASEDDEVLVDGISKDPNALGYFGYSYYEKHQDKLKALAVDNGKGPVLPSRQTVEKVQYQPLSRPLFIYVNTRSTQNNSAAYQFVKLYIENAPKVVSTVGYVPLPEEVKHLNYVHFYKGKAGTVFDGQTQLNLTIGELLRKEAKF
ncbi:PstS family phosphate ABC transporter substrate-binding protein [Hassallia byssoidea VB512170]|uniref:Phosphate-binding protein n=1 Tax=Hassallia byssoidea VB512170 TaxID=1304833 RepID=A0A846H268_9CYAN|nr:PstS family phosphate ABC transporter substrate-binding protein [Hassalia byssoidea]NEU71797.1 PstS family phosphate ABC transporter substrate-binding protein [Hassalia byssoidea VB512170]